MVYSGTTTDPGSTVTVVEDSAGEGTIQAGVLGDSLVAEAFDLLSPSLLTVGVTWVVDFDPGINQSQLDALEVTKQTDGDPLVISHVVSDTQWSEGKIVQATLEFTLVDDAEIWASAPLDTDGDGIMNHYDLNHDGDFDDPNEDDLDDDNDDFDDTVEAFVGTHPLDDCSDDPGDDAWPPDIDGNATCDVTDALEFLASFPSGPGSPNYNPRMDMVACPDVIDVTDALIFLDHFPSACPEP